MKRIAIEFIENVDQRYDTCGDYWEEPQTLEMRITKYRNEKYAHLILIHELVEMLLARQRGIKFSVIDEFDLMYLDEGEPGNDPSAPYHKEHIFATHIEKLCAQEMGVDWTEYEKTVDEGEPTEVLYEEWE